MTTSDLTEEAAKPGGSGAFAVLMMALLFLAAAFSAGVMVRDILATGEVSAAWIKGAEEALAEVLAERKAQAAKEA